MDDRPRKGILKKGDGGGGGNPAAVVQLGVLGPIQAVGEDMENKDEVGKSVLNNMN